ncbi:hypothetical protein LT335_00679 [Spiroplasma sp. JKS002669]|uniref:hypothetical protein n=1 Tax=Spiroplasma attinicola TaxID=2904537 RepID=UPI002022EE25|nr:MULTISPECIES: hypothetical protein [unclassified Spiroplasma]MCL6429117.1 hypothetical protein [Spiroplasma sp. JKS002669]MCL8209568.1 hypothetical protein [Spiroplasma sp. JKS002670]
MTKKDLTSIFLNKNWIINETPKAVAITAPQNYFTRKNNDKMVIWFSKSSVSNSIKFENRMIVWIDLNKDYQIITLDSNNKEIAKTAISGQELHQEIKATINQMKENYLAKKK